MAKPVDYSLYLVTGRHVLPPGVDYATSLEEALKGGVTIVQVREKDTETNEFIEIARLTKSICTKYGVPVLINDRLDVALAIDADGVHVGQSDMPVEQARKLLPPGKIIGVSCDKVEHVKKAIQDKVDYIGIGAVWGTKTKKLSKLPIGVQAVGPMLDALEGTNIRAVAIGGIKSTNLLRTLHGCVSSNDRPLDGVAIVSDIVSSLTPKASAEKLASILAEFKNGFSPSPQDGRLAYPSTEAYTPRSVLAAVTALMNEIRTVSPLVHQITNTVVQTQSANLTLALGASPIMANEPREMEDLVRVCGALLINIGTLREEQLESMVLAGTFANIFRKPIVFDPVGVGASSFRKGSVKGLLDTWQATVIKGNAGELAALAGTTEVKSKGVDSVGDGFRDPATFVKALARQQRCTVVLTGPTDYISDGNTVVTLSNGDSVLGKITGAGCMLGSCIASYCAVASKLAGKTSSSSDGSLVSGDMLPAAVAGVLVLTVATDIAVEQPSVKGPGTFLPTLIDTLWNLTPEQVQERAKIVVC